MDFTDYKFRCSQLGRLISKSGKLTLETKSYLLEIFIKEKYGREKEITSKYMDKGLYVEQDSLDIASSHYEKFLVKNKKTLNNDYITGTPDVILAMNKTVIDIKSSWDIWTFAKADGTNWDYYWQLQGYMWLTGLTKAELAYCLSDAPEHLIYQEVLSTAYRKGLKDMQGTPEFEEMENNVIKNMKFPDIDIKDKIKTFKFDYSESDIELLKNAINEARIYLGTLSL